MGWFAKKMRAVRADPAHGRPRDHTQAIEAWVCPGCLYVAECALKRGETSCIELSPVPSSDISRQHICPLTKAVKVVPGNEDQRSADLALARRWLDGQYGGRRGCPGYYCSIHGTSLFAADLATWLVSKGDPLEHARAVVARQECRECVVDGALRLELLRADFRQAMAEIGVT